VKFSVVECGVAWFGLAVGVAMALMKVIPTVPGHFTLYEWLALGIWITLGMAAAVVGKERAR